MRRFLSLIGRGIYNAFSILFTGGRFGTSVPSKHTYTYSKSQEQRRKDFEKFGSHPCKLCRTIIPYNKSYCGACFHKYIKK